MKKTLYRVSSALMLVAMLFLSPVFTSPASAAVTTQDIHEQRLVVKSELIDVLQEHVQLLQLVVINRLESRVATLQALVEARTK